MNISSHDQKILFDSLYFMNMAELKQICAVLTIPLSKGKADMIDAIKHFVKTGQILSIKTIPEASRAKKGKNYPLMPDTLILFGDYKNDAKTRAFFKKLIGNHFHFTAFGIDWINDCWHAGKPPTYQEYADMWQREFARRNNEKPQPKKEWAYINFLLPKF